MALLTQTEAAELVGVTPRSIQNWEKGGQIKGTKVGRAKYYDSAVIEAAGRAHSEAQLEASRRQQAARKPAKAPAVVCTPGVTPGRLMVHVDDEGDLRANYQAESFPDEIEAEVCPDQPSHVEYTLHGKRWRAFGGARLVLKAGNGKHMTSVEYGLTGDDVKMKHGNLNRVLRVYTKMKKSDRGVGPRVAADGLGGGSVALPNGGYGV